MTDQEPNIIIDTNELIAQRRAKLDELRSQGNAYPNTFVRDTLASKLHAEFSNKTEPELEAGLLNVKVAGRIMTRRLMGKASFVHLQDMSGKIQLYVRQDEISLEAYEAFLHWDIGDIIPG